MTGGLHALTLTVYSAFLLVSLALGRRQQERPEELLKNLYGSTISVSSSSLVVLSSEKDSLRAALGIAITWDTLNVFVADNGAKRVGYAIIDEVRGKDQPITYCVVVDELLAVKQVAILAYREPYGGEVQNESWLNQFSGKRPGDKLRPGKEIKNITGATISARAITLGVKKLLTLLHVIAPRLQSLASVSK
jgi:Na+-translocating ferredoxin:NAD+ oxidoreductase RnfG subunit